MKLNGKHKLLIPAFTIIGVAAVTFISVNQGDNVKWDKEGFDVGNSSNQGLITTNGNYTVFASSTNGVYFKESNTKNSKENPIAKVRAFHVNATKEGIYYENNTEESHLYFTSYDGKKHVELVPEPVSNVKVIGEDIYYTTNLGDPSLYKMSTDGKEKQKILDKGTLFYTISDEYIYYSDFSDDFKLYKMDLNGENREKVVDMQAWRISIVDDYIYFENSASFEGKLYRVPVTGGEPELIIDALVDGYIVIGDEIYYSTALSDENSGFSKYNMANKETIKLSSDVFYGFGVVGNSLLMNKFGPNPMVEFNLTTQEFTEGRR